MGNSRLEFKRKGNKIISTKKIKMKKYIINMLVAMAVATTAQAQVPEITTQPQNAKVCVGSKATFSIAASNNPTNVIWEYSLNDGETWSDITNINWASTNRYLTYVDVEPLSGATINGHKTSHILIHAIAANSSGNSLPSQAAILTINTATDSLFIAKPNSIATCVGNSFMLAGSQANGVFSSSNNTVATVNCSGMVNVKAQGTSSIKYIYTSTNGCSDTASYALNTTSPTAAIVSGLTSVCVGANTTYTANVNDGEWGSNGRLSINNKTGAATATSVGITAVNYTITGSNGCTTKTAYAATVIALPAVPSVAYAPGTTNPQTSGSGLTFCKNKTFTLRGKPTGGTWSATGGVSITPLNAQEASVTTTANGAMQLSYTIGNNTCTNKRTFSGTVVSCSKGIVNSSLNAGYDFKVYPNPAHSFLNIKVGSGIKNAVITDLYGKQVKLQTLNTGLNTIDISSFAKGMYLLTIVGNNIKETQKIVVE